MPDGFKAMVVATSREACLRYHTALVAARDELVNELEQAANGPGGGDLDPDESFLATASGSGST